MADTKATIDGLERLRFFNCRSGRELWGDKPKNVQDEDIKSADTVLADAIKLLTAQRKGQGHWNHTLITDQHPFHFYLCSSCGVTALKESAGNYCYNCGAWMDNPQNKFDD